MEVGEFVRRGVGLQVRSRPQTTVSYCFASCRARAVLILRTTRRTVGPRKSCSQIRTTPQPLNRSSLDCARSRWILRAILAFQYGRFEDGIEPQRGQPCQKQPSTNTASRARGKAKSGFPAIGYCRRQPVMWEARKAATRANSVDLFPFERTAAITRER